MQPRCKHCGADLEFTTTLEDDFYDADTIELVVSGGCPNCHKQYRWKEYYNYTHYEDLEEIIVTVIRNVELKKRNEIAN